MRLKNEDRTEMVCSNSFDSLTHRKRKRDSHFQLPSLIFPVKLFISRKSRALTLNQRWESIDSTQCDSFLMHHHTMNKSTIKKLTTIAKLHFLQTN